MVPAIAPRQSRLFSAARRLKRKLEGDLCTTDNEPCGSSNYLSGFCSCSSGRRLFGSPTDGTTQSPSGSSCTCMYSPLPPAPPKPPPPPSPPSPPPPAPPPTLSSVSLVASQSSCSFSTGWKAIFEPDPRVCAAVVLLSSECIKSPGYFHHAGGNDNNCGCMESAGDCSDPSNQQYNSQVNIYQITSAMLPVVTQLQSGRKCNSNTWLDIYHGDARVCAAVVLAKSDCSSEYFTHATDGDGNCGCTSVGTDCSTQNGWANTGRTYSISGGGWWYWS